MKKFYHNIHLFLLGLLLLFATACSDKNGGGDTRSATTVPVILTIAAPQRSNTSAQSRAGDPGDGTQESYEDWNRLTIILAFTEKPQSDDIYDPEPNKMIYTDTFTKDEFDKTDTVDVTLSNGSVLSKKDANGYRTYTMYVPMGTVNVYGVTYSVNEKGAAKNNDKLNFNPETALQGKNTTEDVKELTISNDYAGDDLAKFMSVATGYATIVDNNGISTGIRDLKIFKGNEATMKQYWRMPLTRLATKLDIQWDAYQGYNDGKLEDCKVSSFQYDGGAGSEKGSEESSEKGNEKGSGYGRLFPSLQTGNSVTAIGGKKDFYNQTPISQRNGRVYHYLYPDGSKAPKITFNLNITEKDKDTGTTNNGNKTYTFLLKELAPLKQATWYKINTKIKGNSAQTTFVINKNTDTDDNDDESAK